MEELMNYCNNYFAIYGESGEHTLTENSVKIDLKAYTGMFLLIRGSLYNDGLYEVIDASSGHLRVESFIPEIFEGSVYLCKPPKAFVELSKKIDEYRANEKKDNITHESLGNYSYTKATNSKGIVLGWKDIFLDDLKPYKRLFNNLGSVLR